jgi:hypothetical protein
MKRALPAVKFTKGGFIISLKDTKKLRKQCFPGPQFHLMHEIDNEHQKKIKTELR